ncbi:hypothetical protein HG452_003105 [Candidatus Saccharibacteria bacterium]|nr:hypothetical protein [Candidatus Saccharibacteria bacterium]
MAIFIKYKLVSLREMVTDGYIRLHPVQLAEKEISNIAEKLIKSLLDDKYDPIKIIEIFSKEFDKSQVREIVAFYIGIENLELLEESENET